MNLNESIPTKRTHRFLALDGMRGVAAVLVAARHIGPIAILLPRLQSFLAVDLFFCLSGFVIGYAYEERLKADFTFSDFTIVRFVRLYPLYILGILLGVPNLVGKYHFGSHGSWFSPALACVLLLNVFFLPNLIWDKPSGMFPGNSPAWSLSYEIVANLLYGLLARLRLARSRNLLFIILVSFVLDLRYVMTTHQELSVGYSFSPIGLARVGYSFFLGILLYRAYQSGYRIRLHRSLSTALAAFSVIAAALLLTVSISGERGSWYDLAAISLGFPLIVYLGACAQVPLKWTGICVFLGDFSYPLYALHYPLTFPLRALYFLRANLGWPVQLLCFATSLALIPATWWIGRVYDAPIRRYLTRKTLGLHTRSAPRMAVRR